MDSGEVSIQAALRAVQTALKAPKGQRNTFGNYDYRSAEDILEAVKPLLAEYGLTLVIDDSIELIGERYYVRAEATVFDSTGKFLSATAYAREAEDKKGMDSAQVTGATSSYARKYALNGLFAIDDTKDADSQDNRSQGSKKQSNYSKPATTQSKPAATGNRASTTEPASDKQIGLLKSLARRKGKDDEWVAKVLMTVSSKAGASEVIDKLNALEDAA